MLELVYGEGIRCTSFWYQRYNQLMENIFQRLLDNNLTELDGLTVDATIPVTESLANEIITVSLQENQQIEYVSAYIHGENRITLDVKSSLWPWPLKVKLKLFASVDVKHSPTIRAFLENHLLLVKLGSLIQALPNGINIYKDQLSINIEALIPIPELRNLLGLIQVMEIRTEEGRIFFDIKIRQ